MSTVFFSFHTYVWFLRVLVESEAELGLVQSQRSVVLSPLPQLGRDRLEDVHSGAQIGGLPRGLEKKEEINVPGGP